MTPRATAALIVLICSAGLPAAARAAPQVDFVGGVYCVQEGGGRLPIGGVYVGLKDEPADWVRSKHANGYYRLRGPFAGVYDSSVTVVYRTVRKVLATETVFVSRGRRLRNRRGRLVFHMDPMVLPDTFSCERLANEISESDSLGLEPPEASQSSGAEGGGSALNLLLYFGQLFTAFGAGANDVIITRTVRTELPLDYVTPYESPIGFALARRRTRDFPSFGFRYSPLREVAAAQITNAAAAALAPGPQLSTSSRVEPLPRIDTGANLAVPFEGWALSFGYRLRLRRSRRTVSYDGGDTFRDSFFFDEHGMMLSASRALTDTLAVGVTGRLYYQRRDEPDYVERVETYGYSHGSDPAEEYLIDTDDELVTRSDSRLTADADVSVVWDVTPDWRLGAAVLNVVGSETMLPGRQDHDRTIGFGATHIINRWHIGADFEYSNLLGPNASMGFSVIPLDDVEVGLGMMTLNRTVKVLLRLRSLVVTYRWGSTGHVVSLGARIQ